MTAAAWTWMVYMATNNNVAAFGEQSLARMRTVHYDDNVRMLVQQATPDGSVRRIVGADPEVVADLGQIDSGDPATLIDFIRWVQTTAPAQRYALVLWSHGSGWEPAEMERLAQQQPALQPVTKEELTNRGVDDGHLAFFSSTIRTLLSQPTPPQRAVVFDDGSGHSLDTIELGHVVAQAKNILGQSVDLLGMSACLMSTVEVAYQVRNDANVYVASEDLMPARSWPFEDILTRLRDKPDMDAVTLGKLIVERYCASFLASSPQTPPDATLTALKLDGIAALATAVSTFAAALQKEITSDLTAIWNAHRATHPFQFRLYDLAGFCRSLLTQPAIDADSLAAANGVLAALTDPAFLLAVQHTTHTYDNTAGLDTYMMPPTPGKVLSPYYAETAYAQATGWGTFLAAYHAAVF